MGDEIGSHLIKLSYLREHQKIFQKDLRELIDIYLADGKRKIVALKKAFEDNNRENFAGALQDLRYRSIDIGAHQFSYYCLSLEIAANEMRIDSLPRLIAFIEKSFDQVQAELERLKNTSLCKKPSLVY
jgi:acetolactate synthase small subunit